MTELVPSWLPGPKQDVSMADRSCYQKSGMRQCSGGQEPVAGLRQEGGRELPAGLSWDRQVPPACVRKVVGPRLPGGPVLAPPSPTQLLEPESSPAPPTDARVANRSEPRGGPEGAPDRCQVQRGSQASGDSQELHTKGSRVTGEKQGQMGPASPCQQGSLRSARPGPSALMPLARPTLGPDPALLQMLSPPLCPEYTVSASSHPPQSP